MSLSPEKLRARLRGMARKFTAVRSLCAVLAAFVLGGFALLAFGLADALIHFTASGRWIGFLAVVGPWAAGVLVALGGGWLVPSEAAMARRIEARGAVAGNPFISAVQLDAALAGQSDLRAAVFEELGDPFLRVRWAGVFEWGVVRGWLYGALGVAAAAALLFALDPARAENSARRILFPGASIPPLTKTRLDALEPGSVEVPHRGSVAVRARLSGVVPSAAQLLYREPGGAWQRLPMRIAGTSAFEASLSNLTQHVDYTVKAGDAVVPTDRITVLPKTAIRSLAVTVTPPAYTRLPNTVLRDAREVPGLVPGSMVEATCSFNAPLASFSAGPERGEAAPVERLGANTWRFRVRPKVSVALGLAFEDTHGAREREALALTVVPDSPPQVEILDPPEGKRLVASRTASVRIRFACRDRFGLASVALARTGAAEGSAGEEIRAWKDAAGKTSFEGEAAIVPKILGTPEEGELTLVVVARDANDVTGPGVTVSRPITITLRSAEAVRKEQVDLAAKVEKALRDLIALQETNLGETRKRAGQAAASAEEISPLVARQAAVAEAARTLVPFAEAISRRLRDELVSLGDREMKDAVLALREATATGPSQRGALQRGAGIEARILARLQGLPETLAADLARDQIRDLLGCVEALLRRQKELQTETGSASMLPPLAPKQDALADECLSARRALEAGGKNSSLGMPEFLAKVTKAAALLAELKVYEDMLAAAGRLQASKKAEASAVQARLITNLSRIAALLTEARAARAKEETDRLKKLISGIEKGLDKMAEEQKGVIEKSKDLAKKDSFNPDDLSTAKKLSETKDKMEQEAEAMLVDAHAFPELRPANELRSILNTIFEDVVQSDLKDIAEGKLTAKEVPVQKEESLLKDIEKAKEIAKDMEMWLPDASDTVKWLMENFDVAEMPEIPNLPLPDVLDDLVGDLLKEQQSIADQVIDAASNNALAQAPQGWAVMDGPMPGFSAQGKSGNQRPNPNEQTGRSAGGREGMSSGEMVADAASNLEGSATKARRTRDPMQQGQVKDETGGAARATGGGKAGGFSDRMGMDGQAPLRASTAPRQATADALAVQQALLSQKSASTASKAEMLYLRSDPLRAAAKLMEESRDALRDGRVRDIPGLHQRIVRELNSARGSGDLGPVVHLPGATAVPGSDRQAWGGAEGEAPAVYREMLGEYYRSLGEGK